MVCLTEYGGGIISTGLCDRLFLSKQTINSLVSGMVKRDLSFWNILREAAPEDHSLDGRWEKIRKRKGQMDFEAEQRAMEDTDPVEVQA